MARSSGNPKQSQNKKPPVHHGRPQSASARSRLYLNPGLHAHRKPGARHAHQVPPVSPSETLLAGSVASAVSESSLPFILLSRPIPAGDRELTTFAHGGQSPISTGLPCPTDIFHIGSRWTHSFSRTLSQFLATPNAHRLLPGAFLHISCCTGSVGWACGYALGRRGGPDISGLSHLRPPPFDKLRVSPRLRGATPSAAEGPRRGTEPAPYRRAHKSNYPRKHWAAGFGAS
jgi:hypothetical protein